MTAADVTAPEPTPAEHLRRAQDLLRHAEAAHSYGHHTTSTATAALATAQATTALAGALVEFLGRSEVRS